MLEQLYRHVRNVEDYFHKNSMQKVPPVLVSFPKLAIHPSVDMYAVFRYEPMHNLSLGVSNILKLLLFTIVKDCYRTSKSICTMYGAPKPFNALRKYIFHKLNRCCRKVKVAAAGRGRMLIYIK